MKRKIVYAEAILLSLASAWSVVGCLITAFDLPVTLDERTAILWGAVCMISMVLFSFRRGGLVGLVLTAAGLAAAWRWLNLRKELLALLGWIARVYDNGYGWGIPEVLRVRRGGGDLAAALLGALVIESIVYTVCRRKGNPLAVAMLVLPLASCLVVTDTIPDFRCFFVLLTCLVLLLLTDSVRAESGNQGSRLAMGVAVPVMMALGLLFYFFPLENYENTTAELRTELISRAQEYVGKVQRGEVDFSGFVRRKDQVDLANLASQSQLGLPIAEVTAERDGAVYLRVQDFDVYTGTTWVSSSSRQETLVGTGESRGAVVVRELSGQGGMMLPSFPADGAQLTDGMAVNETGEKVYHVDCVTAAMTATPEAAWLKLPEGTGLRVRDFLRQIPGDMTDVENAVAAIGDYVRGSAEYSRRVPAMPEDREDFALWFLEEADEGFCVHFATAAAVLLRGAGIPARYVTGYKAEAMAGEPIRVTSNDAHAWVEYYNYKTWSWSILEVTPGELTLRPEESTTEPTRTTQPETTPTNPAQTEAPTRQTEPQLQPEQTQTWHLPVWIPAAVLGILGIIGGAELQRAARIRFRRRRQQTGAANARAIARWAEIRILSRLAEKPIPEELEQLAEKAMFSQHSLTKEELASFAAYSHACRRRLTVRPWYRKLAYRYWNAVI